MNELFDGILLGLGVCVPFGPVNILILSYALKSFKNAFSLGLGAFVADLLYLFVLSFGVLEFIKNDLFLDILSVFGSLFLIYLAYLMLKPVKNIDIKNNLEKTNVFLNFIKGFFINLANPYVITFWLSVATMLSTKQNPFYLLIGLSFSIFIWIFFLSFFVYKYTDFFSVKVLRIINILSALILVYFAVTLVLGRFL